MERRKHGSLLGSIFNHEGAGLLARTCNQSCLFFKNDFTEVWQSAILKHLLFYRLQLSKPLYKLTIMDRQADRQAEKATYRGTSLRSAQKLWGYSQYFGAIIKIKSKL